MARARFWDRPLALFLLVFASLCLIAVSTLKPEVFSGVRVQAADGMSPLLAVLSAPFQNVTMAVRDASGLSDLKTRNALLEEENKRLREWYQTALLFEAENKSLRELLNVKVDPHRSYVTARILSDSGADFVKSMVVKAGKADGVKKNDAVISGQGLIGRVVEVGESTSRVLLVTDMNSRIPVMIENTSQHAILAGQNSYAVTLDHLPDDTLVQEGARVVTSGDGGIFPAGLPVGKVAQYRNNKPEIALFVDFSALQFVRIVSEARDPNLIPGPVSVNEP